MPFLTDLYTQKGWSLRRISKRLGCSKNTVRKQLCQAGVEVLESRKADTNQFKEKIIELRAQKKSYQEIANIFNHQKIKTRTGKGKWHAKTIREIFLRTI